MIYFIIIGIVIALLLKRNPISILLHIKLRVPYLIIGSFLIQIILAVVAAKTHEQYPMILILTFAGIIASLFLNRHLTGVKWILAGTVLNMLALLLHGGMMPVSENAMRIAGLEDLGFDSDSRHRLMETSLFWWLGDWIPLITPIGTNYVISLGDLVVGIGFIVLIVRTSVVKGERE